MSELLTFEPRSRFVSAPSARLFAQFLVLLLCLRLNTKLNGLFPEFWIFEPLAISIFLFRSASLSRSLTNLWTLIGALSAVYSFVRYPLLPSMDGESFRYAILILVWIASIISGALCFRYPSLSIIAPAFLLWSQNQARLITGLPTTNDIDISPLVEVSMAIGIGLAISKFLRILRSSEEERRSFETLLLVLAIAVHLANYFWSFIAKAKLGNYPWTWVLQNNPANIFLTALDDDHVLFSAYPALVSLIYRVIDTAHLASNIGIFAIQGLALLGVLLPKRIFIFLLIAFDGMHLAIALVAGANFWPWIILNLIIAYVVARSKVGSIDLKLRLLATAFILIAPKFVSITKLGWFDSGVNNKLYFEAVYADGTRSNVPTNFFTFYSYYFAHMDYGLPNPSIGLEVGSPNGAIYNNNGAVYTLRTLRAATACDVGALRSEQHERIAFQQDEVDRFVRNYHHLALNIERQFGVFPFNIYPHHFYVPISVGAAFDTIPKVNVVAYIYRQESVCLSYSDRLDRRVIGSDEYRIQIR